MSLGIVLIGHFMLWNFSANLRKFFFNSPSLLNMVKTLFVLMIRLFHVLFLWYLFRNYWNSLAMSYIQYLYFYSQFFRFPLHMLVKLKVHCNRNLWFCSKCDWLQRFLTKKNNIFFRMVGSYVCKKRRSIKQLKFHDH